MKWTLLLAFFSFPVLTGCATPQENYGDGPTHYPPSNVPADNPRPSDP